jgi:hypothetical protein
MRLSSVIKNRAAVLIFMIVFIFMVSLILACSITSRKAWYKYSSTQEEFTKDRNECRQQSRQLDANEQRMHSTGAFCLDFYCEHDQLGDEDSTNWDLFTACMEAHGWSLAEKKQKQN